MSEVISFRVKKRIKQLMNMVKINWRKEVEEFIETGAKEILRREILKDSEHLLTKMKKINNAQLIREDHDAR